MKITDLEIGQFATRDWYNTNNKSSMCVKRYSQNSYEYWENGNFSSKLHEFYDDTMLQYTDFELCDCNGNIIQETVYPLYMESIGDNSVNDRVVKFVSLTEGTVIIQGNSITLPSHRSTSWIEHTSTKHWKHCDFSKAPEVEDIDYWDARYNAGLQVYFSFNHENNKTCYKAFEAPSVLFKDNKNIKLHIFDETKLKTESDYPLYFECINNPLNKGMIVKFTELNKGLLVKEAKNGICKITIVSSEWTKHTNKETWKQVDFDETIGKIIPTTDDIGELISDLKSIIEDDYNSFSPSEYGAGTQPRESGYDQCSDLIYEWMDKYNIAKAPNIDDEKNFKYFDDLVDIIVYIEDAIHKKKFSEPIIGVDYASKPDVAFVPQEGIKSRLNDDALDSLTYALHFAPTTLLSNDAADCASIFTTGATEVVNNLNQTKEFTMNNELKDAILELIATNGKPKVKKPKTAKIVCNVEGTLMEFADEAALKSFMWSSRVESVIKYDLAGKVTVPFELSVEAPKTKASK